MAINGGHGSRAVADMKTELSSCVDICVLRILTYVPGLSSRPGDRALVENY